MDRVGFEPTTSAQQQLSKQGSCMHLLLSHPERFCRKLHGSWLHKEGVPSEVVDFLQGRVSTSVFSRHYLTPQNNFKDKVIYALCKLQKEIEN